MNLLSKRPLGAWTVWLGDYKTFKSRGVDETSFTEELFSDLNDVLNQYLLQGYRDCLVNDSDHKYVFVTTKGEKFESSSYSKYLSSLLFRLTGSKSTSNILRSSFVVNLLESPEGHDSSIRASVASLMHHSVGNSPKLMIVAIPQVASVMRSLLSANEAVSLKNRSLTTEVSKLLLLDLAAEILW